ncbi:MAG: cytidylyltransferase domain-containing protein, partial [Chitinophagaceae bacterium]
MKKIAVIPARYAASRFPGKLLKPLGDKTVIAYTYLATLQTGLFDEVLVATDSGDIKKEIEQY